MKTFKLYVTRTAFVLYTLAFAILYPIFAAVAAPWAWYNTLGTWGWTTWDDWKRDWADWRTIVQHPVEAIREAFRWL